MDRRQVTERKRGVYAVHYSGGLRAETKTGGLVVVAPGFPVCHERRAMAQTEWRGGVTCKRCLALMESK